MTYYYPDEEEEDAGSLLGVGVIVGVGVGVGEAHNPNGLLSTKVSAPSTTTPPPIFCFQALLIGLDELVTKE